MNDFNQLREELRREAANLSLTSTGVDTIVERGERRMGRRRTSAAVCGVLAVVAISAVGVQQLSRVDDATIPMQAPDDSVAAPTATSMPSGTTEFVVAPTTVPAGQIEISGAQAAQPASPGMTWTVLDGASPEAIALRYGDSTQRYALATEPVQNGVARDALFEHRDGEWVQLASDVLPEGLNGATISGEAIYAVGTAPATAGAAPGSVGRYDIETAEWSLTALPDEIRPYRSELVNTATDMSIAPLTDAALIAVNRHGAWVDPVALESLLGGVVIDSEPLWNDGALTVPVRCDHGAINAALENAELDDEADYLALQRAELARNCEIRTFTAEDLGLTADDVAALDAPRGAGLWRYDGATITPVDLPDPGATTARLQDGVLTTGSDDGQQVWFVAADGTFEAAFDGVVEGDLGSARPFDGQLIGGYGPYVVTDAPAASSTATDLRPVVVDDTMVNPTVWTNSVATSGQSTMAIVHVEYRSVSTIDVPTTIVGSGYDLVIDPAEGVTVIDQSTGSPVLDGYRLVSAPGSVKLVESPRWNADDTTASPTTILSADTAAPTTTSVPSAEVDADASETEIVVAEFDVDPETLPMWSSRSRTVIASSIDGLAYAVESFAELVGAGDGQWADVGSVDVVDGRYVIRGWVTDRQSESRSVILVGTPTD